MADSNTTKKALASALKELIAEKTIEKISIGDICRQCDMSRKSFYYHFKDKEDLVNWIFDSEFVAYARTAEFESFWTAIEALMQYFYENRLFYRRILLHEGQNSFSKHFNDLLHEVFAGQLQQIIRNPKIRDFQINFIADGMVCMLKRWIGASECIPPEEFVGKVKFGAQLMAEYIFRTLCCEDGDSTEGELPQNSAK